MLDFDLSTSSSSYIKVIGVGGGGGNAVNNMYAQGIKGVDFIVCNTDEKALNASKVPNKIALGKLGAGNKPQVARKAALTHKEEILEALKGDTQMLFITAGMGGGTGTGAAPVVAEIAKSIELDDEEMNRILVVAVVTMPFSFEGRRRETQAKDGIEELRKHVDSILIINNDKLKSLGGNLSLPESFKRADDVLYTAVKGIAELITVSDYVNIDIHDVNTVMQNSGTALMGTGIGRGEDRAMEAIRQASTSVLLNDNNIDGAKNVLLYFSYSPENPITMDELQNVTDYLTDITGHNADVIWGAGDDNSLSEELKITLIATGFETEDVGTIIDFGPEKENKEKEDKNNGQPLPPLNEGGITVIHQPNTQELVKQQETPTSKAEEKGHVYTLDDVPELDEVPNCSATAHSELQNTIQEPIDDEGIVMIHHSEPAKKTPIAPVHHVEPAPMEKEVEPVTEGYIPQPAAMSPVTPLDTKVTTMEAPSSTQVSERLQSTERNAILSRADRLSRARRMNELLHRDDNGVRMVEQMTTAELTSEEIYQAPHSSESDAMKSTMDKNGNIKKVNTYLYGLLD